MQSPYFQLPFSDQQLAHLSTDDAQLNVWRAQQEPFSVCQVIESADLRLLRFLVVERGLDVNAFYVHEGPVVPDFMRGTQHYTPLGFCILHARYHLDRRWDYLKCFRFLVLHGAHKFRAAKHYTGTFEFQNDEPLLEVLLDEYKGWSLVHTLQAETLQTKDAVAEWFLFLLGQILEGIDRSPNKDLILNAAEMASQDQSPLILMLQFGHSAAAFIAHICVHGVQMMLAVGADPNPNYGALCMALDEVTDTNACVCICQMLLDAGANVNEHPRGIDQDGSFYDNTPLVAATTRTGDDAVLLTHLLLDARGPPNPNIACRQHEVNARVSCLYFASVHPTHSRTLLKLLFLAGANPYTPLPGRTTIMRQMAVLDATNGTTAAQDVFRFRTLDRDKTTDQLQMPMSTLRLRETGL